MAITYSLKFDQKYGNGRVFFVSHQLQLEDAGGECVDYDNDTMVPMISNDGDGDGDDR